ncbi:hypothetical protein ACFV1L_13055 [Kitasatospora sp. NPDC059646]|uniref:hypothetical protein n=1 Tax=Kitasatospora sp. NPDC059646 TaxID=3346893 RepID=UPI0036998FF4
MQNGTQNNTRFDPVGFASAATSGPSALTGGQAALVPPRPAFAPFIPEPGIEQAQLPATPTAAMPRSVKLARIALVAPTALNLVLALVTLLQAQALLDSFTPYRGAWFAGATSSQEQAAQAGVTLAQFGLAWTAAHTVIAIALAVRAGRGGHSLRTAVLVFGGWQCLLGTLALALSGENSGNAVIRALVALAPGALLVYLATRPETVAWFNRPRR